MYKYITAIYRYFLELKDSNLKETPRREKFLVILNDIFPNSSEELSKYTDGAETSVGIQGSRNEIVKTGRVDAYFGDLIIKYVSGSVQGALARMRAMAREAVVEELKEIDDLVHEMLGT